jgi:hypothetical protein
MFIERRKMMRKLLILMLVLGMAPLAGATISIVNTAATVGLSGTYTVQVSSDVDSGAWTGFMGNVATSVGSVTSAWANTIAGSDRQINPQGAPYSGYYQIKALDLSAPADTIQAGVQFEAVVIGLAEGSYNFYLYDSSWSVPVSPDGTFTLTVIPEPMTMALLGLGGLLLRRRK